MPAACLLACCLLAGLLTGLLTCLPAAFECGVFECGCTAHTELVDPRFSRAGLQTRGLAVVRAALSTRGLELALP